jgi:hypothetical protein
MSCRGCVAFFLHLVAWLAAEAFWRRFGGVVDGLRWCGTVATAPSLRKSGSCLFLSAVFRSASFRAAQATVFCRKTAGEGLVALHAGLHHALSSSQLTLADMG